MKALSYPLFKVQMHKEFHTLNMQTESRTNKKTLKDFNIQGSNLDLKYSGPYTNINTTEVLCSLATLPQLLLVETGKTESKLPQLSSPRFPFSPPSLLHTLYFVLFSWSFDCKISNLQILSQREFEEEPVSKSSLVSSQDSLFSIHPAFALNTSTF